jgi:PadR family transcriptional regulator PadR
VRAERFGAPPFFFARAHSIHSSRKRSDPPDLPDRTISQTDLSGPTLLTDLTDARPTAACLTCPDPSGARLTGECLLCQHLNVMPATDVYALGEFEQIVLLAILRLGDAAYAVSVREEILRCTGRNVSRGSVYITLDRLETKGFLRSRLADPTPERGGRAKRYYLLRPRAIEALKDSRRALVALWRGLETALG